MNRRITLLGIFLFLLSVALIIEPIALYNHLRLNLEVEIGLLLQPIALTVIFWGLASPDPGITTIGGVFGNPDENVLRRLGRPAPFESRLRYLPGPKEPVNCRKCYTLIPWNVAECPRCAKRRECRACGRRLFYLSGAVRCAPCVRDEVYCNCPKLSRPTGAAGIRGKLR